MSFYAEGYEAEAHVEAQGCEAGNPFSLPRAKSTGGGVGRVILLSRGQREKGNLFARESWPFKAADFIQLIHLEEAYFILTHLSG